MWEGYALLSIDYIILKLFHFHLIRQHLLEPKHYVICVIDKMYWALFYILFYSISINVDKDNWTLYIYIFFYSSGKCLYPNTLGRPLVFLWNILYFFSNIYIRLKDFIYYCIYSSVNIYITFGITFYKRLAWKDKNDSIFWLSKFKL